MPTLMDNLIDYVNGKYSNYAYSYEPERSSGTKE